MLHAVLGSLQFRDAVIYSLSSSVACSGAEKASASCLAVGSGSYTTAQTQERDRAHQWAEK